VLIGASPEVRQGRVAIRLCGAVAVLSGPLEVAVGGPRERAVLAALAIEGHATMPHLIEWLWSEDPPPTARKCVQNAIMLLRRALAPVGMVISRDGDGYRLSMTPAPTTSGPSSSLSSKPCPVPVDLTGPGDPLAGLVSTPAVEAARALIRRERVTAVERLLAARLASDPEAVAVEAERLLEEDPYREQLWSLLLDAHHRAGRTGAALEAFRRARGIIISDLGVEPGPVLVEAHRRVLSFDPATRGARARRARDQLARGIEAAAWGDVERARPSLLSAASTARAAGDADTLAAAAVALAGHGPWLLGDAAVESVLEEAIAAVERPADGAGSGPVEGVEARSRVGGGRRDGVVPLLAALARLRALRGDQRARRHADGALAGSVGAPPPHRTAALVAQLVVAQGPDDTAAREQLGHLLLEHGTVDPVAAGYGHFCLAWAHLERGNAVEAARSRAAGIRVADATAGAEPYLAVQAASARFLEAMLDGDGAGAWIRLDDLATALRGYGDRQMGWFVEASCRALLLEALGQLDQAFDDLDRARRTLPGEALGELAPVLALAAAGRRAEAAARVDDVERAVLRATPRSATWTCNTTALAKVADACERRDLAAIALQQLDTLDARHLVIGGMVYSGSVAHWQGVCLRVLGRTAQARARLEQGLADHLSIGSPPWEALSRQALAGLPGDVPGDVLPTWSC
jgi:DNA-binding SARP family transcriptional activator